MVFNEKTIYICGMELEIEETRGSKPKYDFSGLEVGKPVPFKAAGRCLRKGKATSSFGSSVYNACNKYIKSRGLGWDVVRRTKGDTVYIIRTV